MAGSVERGRSGASPFPREVLSSRHLRPHEADRPSLRQPVGPRDPKERVSLAPDPFNFTDFRQTTVHTMPTPCWSISSRTNSSRTSNALGPAVVGARIEGRHIAVDDRGSQRPARSNVALRSSDNLLGPETETIHSQPSGESVQARPTAKRVFRSNRLKAHRRIPARLSSPFISSYQAALACIIAAGAQPCSPMNTLYTSATSSMPASTKESAPSPTPQRPGCVFRCVS